MTTGAVSVDDMPIKPDTAALGVFSAGVALLGNWLLGRRKIDAEADATVSRTWKELAAELGAKIDKMEARIETLEFQVRQRDAIIVALAYNREMPPALRDVLMQIVPGAREWKGDRA